jgi:Tfp pilus assembly protein PilX
MNQPRKLSAEQGIVAIMVTMIMMVLVTTIILSFSAVIRREQRQALDRQLNSRAYYAAESAINVVNKALDTGATAAAVTKSTCGSALPPALSTYSAAIPTASDLAITCLVVDPLSYDLTYSSIGKDTTQVGHLKSNDAAVKIANIEFDWDSPSGSATFGSGTGFPDQVSWTPTTTVPVLRVDIFAVPPAGNLNAGNMFTGEQAYFLYPDGGAPGITSAGATRISLVQGTCNTNNSPRVCRASIAVTPGNDFYIRIRPIYTDAKVDVTPYTAAPAPVLLTEGQITIDATARSGSVLKRISVRRPVNSSATTPGYAIDSNGDICKKLSVLPGSATDSTCGIP